MLSRQRLALPTTVTRYWNTHLKTPRLFILMKLNAVIKRSVFRTMKRYSWLTRRSNPSVRISRHGLVSCHWLIKNSLKNFITILSTVMCYGNMMAAICSFLGWIKRNWALMISTAHRKIRCGVLYKTVVH